MQVNVFLRNSFIWCPQNYIGLSSKSPVAEICLICIKSKWPPAQKVKFQSCSYLVKTTRQCQYPLIIRNQKKYTLTMSDIYFLNYRQKGQVSNRKSIFISTGVKNSNWSDFLKWSQTVPLVEKFTKKNSLSYLRWCVTVVTMH